MTSWIESFIKYADNLESPYLIRKWSAIAVLSATLEQKVWLRTGISYIYPNLYIFVVADAGIGKSRTINAATKFYRELPEPHIAPTSMTKASMVDCLAAAKRLIMRHGQDALDYNSMFISADELAAFMPEWDHEMAGGLTTFYDVSIPYGEQRRTNEIKIKIKNPQLSLLCGTTPSTLMRTLPEAAWDQGLMSRVIMVYSVDRIITDIFAEEVRTLPEDMLHDLKSVNALCGEFKLTQDFKAAVNDWRSKSENNPPKPTHPKLKFYNARRFGNLMKLAMVSVIDHSNELILTKADFDRALSWLIEAEVAMPNIFTAGAVGGDSKVMEEIRDFVMMTGKGKFVPMYRIINFAKDRIPAYNILKVIHMMVQSNMLKQSAQQDPLTNQYSYRAVLDSHQSQTPSTPDDKSVEHGGASLLNSLDVIDPLPSGKPPLTH